MRDDSRVASVLFMAIKFHLTTKMPAKKENKTKQQHRILQKFTFRDTMRSKKQHPTVENEIQLL